MSSPITKLLIHIIYPFLFMVLSNQLVWAKSDLNCEHWTVNSKFKSLALPLGIEVLDNKELVLSQINKKLQEADEKDIEYVFHLQYAKVLILKRLGCHEEGKYICEELIYNPALYSCNHMKGIISLYISILKGENRYSTLLSALIYVRDNLKDFSKEYIYGTLANMYYHLENYQLAILNFKYAIGFLGNKLNEKASINNNIGLAYANCYDYLNAEIYFKKAIKQWDNESVRKIVSKPKYEQFKGVLINNLKGINSKDNLLEIYSLLREKYRDCRSKKYQKLCNTNRSLITLSDHAYHLEEYKDLEEYIRQIEVNLENNNKLSSEDRPKFEFLRLQNAIVKSDKIAALHFGKKYLDAKKILEQEKQELYNRVSPIDNKWKTELLLEKEKALQFENKLKILMYLLVSILLAFLTIVGFGYWNHKKTHIQIAKHKRQIERALRNTEMLLKEMHHRVKNNLQLVSSIAYIEYEQNGEQFDFDRFENRIISLSLIHRLLYSSEYVESIACQSYLDDLFVNLQNTSDKPFNYNLDILDCNLKPEQMISLGLLINELVINTVKHCKPVLEEDVLIDLELIKIEDNLKLKFKDNGTTFKREIGPEFSLGQNLISLLIQKLKGKSKEHHKNGFYLEVEFKPLN